LTRTGARNKPSYRVVAADTRSPRDGRFIEELGWYDPTRPRDVVRLDLDRIRYWMGRGAQVSDTVKSLVKRAEKAKAAE
jgi:small subunit ribosomal protein S16